MAAANIEFRPKTTDVADQFRREVNRGRWKYTLFRPVLSVYNRVEKTVLQRSKWDCTVDKYVTTLRHFDNTGYDTDSRGRSDGQTAPLCSICETKIFSCKWRKPRRLGKRDKTIWFLPQATHCYSYRPWQSVEMAAQKGCVICSVLWDTALTKHKEIISSPESPSVNCEVEWRTDTSQFTLLKFSSRSTRGHLEVTYSLLYQPGLLLSLPTLIICFALNSLT